MRKFLILSVLCLVSCKPEVYLGPLDSPVGNWKSLSSKYYFDGEDIYEDSLCFYSAISFYKDSLCCIEGVKGTFSWTYDNQTLVVDSTIWKVIELSGVQMTLDYQGRLAKTDIDEIVPEEQSEENSENQDSDAEEEIPAAIEYKGKTIETDGSDYWYIGTSGEKVPCYPKEKKADDGTTADICWWDTRSDIYKPF